jgi:hypothetical protein
MGLAWLIELFERVRDGRPAVTETEYDALASWYRRNELHLYDVGIRAKLMIGPRGFGTTEIVETLRSLRKSNQTLK